MHPHGDRHALNVETSARAVSISRQSEILALLAGCDESFVNAIVGLHATGAPPIALHLPAMAAAAGIEVRWDDFADLSEVVPLLARIYPNGSADVNHFHAAGGMGFVIRELLTAGLLDGSASTVWGKSLADYMVEPELDTHGVKFAPAPVTSLDMDILRPFSQPHQPNGGLTILSGNLGRAVIKISAVDSTYHRITARAAVFDNEADVKTAFKEGRLNGDIAVVGVFRAQKLTACLNYTA